MKLDKLVKTKIELVSIFTLYSKEVFIILKYRLSK